MQVKFRGKRKGGNEWLIGDLNHIQGGVFIFPRENAPLNSPDWFEVEPSSIGMFTQLTDKHGKEIFGAIGEKGGDIIKSSATGGELWLVCFGEYEYSIGYEDTESGYGFYFKIINDVIYSTFGAPDDGVTYEIIGNATDNHELIR